MSISFLLGGHHFRLITKLGASLSQETGTSSQKSSLRAVGHINLFGWLLIPREGGAPGRYVS